MEDEQNYLNSVSSFLIGVCLKCCVYLLGKFDTHQMKTSYYGLKSRHMPYYPTMYAIYVIVNNTYNDDSCLIMTQRADLFGSF